MLRLPSGKPWLLYALLGASVCLNIVQSVNRPHRAAPEPTPDTADAQATAAEGTQSLDPSATESGETNRLSFLEPAEKSVTGTTNDGYNVLKSRIRGSLTQTFSDIAGKDGPMLSAVFSRVYVWDLDLRKDVMRDDEIAALWRSTRAGEVDLPVAWYNSSKYGKTLRAYQYTAPGDKAPSYWYTDGLEVPHRLVDTPVREYTQITSLIKDRPSHKGMDFKTPVGTPVFSPKDGSVVRTNWKFAGNGNCIEVRYEDGIIAKFLHLSENLVKPGERIQKGQLIAKSGNTGHSTAPHLHYQTEAGSKVIDPVDYHGTVRRRLNPEVMPLFLAEVNRLDGLMGQSVASNR